ncbi:hypothetical protein [Kribbella sp. NPDC055071]
MNDRELDHLIARANPFGDDSVRQLPTDRAESDLLEAILSTTEPTTRLRPTRRRRVVIGAAAAVAVAAAVGVVGAILPKDSPVAPFVAPIGAPQPAYAAEVRAVAEANERILIDDPAWKVDSVSEFTAESGDMTLKNGDQSFQITWYAARDYKVYHDGRLRDTAKHDTIQVLGQNATLFRYTNDGTDFATMLPPRGKTFVETRADLGSEQAYRDVLAKLHSVDVTTWLSAMPASVLHPEKVRAAVDSMLVGLPLPAGFTKTPLYKETVIQRYQLGARVTGAVSCAWLDQWTAAKKSGDKAKVAQAVAAMQTSHSWKILQEMKAEGAWSDLVWQYADEIAGKRKPDSKSGLPAHGYKDGLGCR